MPRSSARRGAVEPLVALVALFAVVAGLGLYAGVLSKTLSVEYDRNVAEPTLVRVHDTLAVRGVLRPDRLPKTRSIFDGRRRLNVTITTGNSRWTAGPRPPARPDAASRSVSVRAGGGRVPAGTLRVEVWT